jgi:hypothetical protein
VTAGVLGEECLFMIQSFFREARERKKIALPSGEDG